MGIKVKTPVKTRIRTNDVVQITIGKGSGTLIGEKKGKRGKVISVDRERGTAKVQGLRMVYRHLRQSKDPNQPGGGRIQKESSIALSNLMIVCSKCDKPARIGIRIEMGKTVAGESKVKRIRVCKRCGADIRDDK
jgi:large subunit ribosomal protein L24